MTLILLTGAGFTRNWGGWLANEAFEYVLGRAEVGVELRQRLWADKVRHKGFQDTLGDIQQEAARGLARTAQMLDEFLAALVAMFKEMNEGLAAATLEPEIASFLKGFDYIFTLNQDLLLEHHYFGDDFATPGKWTGWQMPGTKWLSPTLAYQNPHSSSTATRTPDEPSSFKIRGGEQPYFKLHGSSNWVWSDGKPLLVLGGGKETTITRDPLLKRYQTEFASALQSPDAKLMVIGYSFSDPHVDNTIEAAVDAGHGLTVFIVDPLGVDVLDKWRDRPNNIPGPQPFREKINPCIRGASRRPLLATFRNDRVEHAKLMRFLTG